MSGFLCTLFAICASVAAPTDGLPSWEQTARHAIPIVRQWEGTGPTFGCSMSVSGVCVQAYLDDIASPPVWTVGYGQTRLFAEDGTSRPVRQGDNLTIEEAAANLGRNLRNPYWMSYRDCVTLQSGLAPETDAAMTSLTWNIGQGAICRSTALRRLNTGDIAGACQALTRWNRAGNRVIRGLVNRRAAEFELCMQGAS